MPATTISRISKLTRISCLPSTTRLPFGSTWVTTAATLVSSASERFTEPLPSLDMLESPVKIRVGILGDESLSMTILDKINARQDHFGCRIGLCEIVCGQANAPLRGRQAESFAHGAAHPRVRFAVGRPRPFVEPAEDHYVGVLKACFEQTPNK